MGATTGTCGGYGENATMVAGGKDGKTSIPGAGGIDEVVATMNAGGQDGKTSDPGVGGTNDEVVAMLVTGWTKLMIGGGSDQTTPRWALWLKVGG